MSEDLKHLHATLEGCVEAIVAWRGKLPRGLSLDTTLALGEALGTIAKAKALVGRDIDELGAKKVNVPASGAFAPDD